MEGSGGFKVYTHIQWANGLTTHVREAEDTGGFTLSVFNALPHPVKDLVRCKKCTTYKELADAVLSINIGDLCNSTAGHRGNEEMARLTRAPLSPTKAICNMLSTTHIQNPQCTYQPATTTPAMTKPTLQLPTNPFMSTSGRGNLFPTKIQHGLLPYGKMNPGNLGLDQGTRTGRISQKQSNTL